MDQKTDEIRQHIDTEREQLGRNLDEIEYRVKNATDLKAHFDKNTGWVLGAAVAGGFLLSLAFRKSPAPDSSPNWDAAAGQPVANLASPRTHPASKHLHRFSETIDTIVGGLVGVASHKLETFVANSVPGFQAQYDAIDRQRGSRSDPLKPDGGDSGEFSVIR